MSLRLRRQYESLDLAVGEYKMLMLYKGYHIPSVTAMMCGSRQDFLRGWFALPIAQSSRLFGLSIQ